MKLIINARENCPEQGPVALDTVIEFKEAILSGGFIHVTATHPHSYISQKTYIAWTKLQKYIPESFKKCYFSLNTKILGCKRHYFNVLLGQEWNLCFPYMLFPGEKSVYLFDAWPCSHKEIVQFVSVHKISHVFVSSSQVAAKLKSMMGEAVFSWVPEGINPRLYMQREYLAKDIDILELGRKYDAYHDGIVQAMKSDGRIHLYEKTKGVVVFPSRGNLIDGLARTKISICVPSSITHPERSGNIETMTVRYLESMASKCLVVGHAPQEMVELFGYNPVVEIDMENPVQQIRSILDNFDDYIPLIEKNYTETVANHTWGKRWEQIAEIIQSSD